jgi:hypothetical protein
MRSAGSSIAVRRERAHADLLKRCADGVATGREDHPSRLFLRPKSTIL